MPGSFATAVAVPVAAAAANTLNLARILRLLPFVSLRLRLRIDSLFALSAYCRCLTPCTWPRSHRSSDNVHVACATNVALTLHALLDVALNVALTLHCSRIACTADVAFTLQVFHGIRALLLSGSTGLTRVTQHLLVGLAHHEVEYFALGFVFLRTFKSRLQPLVQTRFTVGSSEPWGTQTGVQSSL